MDSCTDCLCWGKIYAQGRCQPCYAFVARPGQQSGSCASCGLRLALKRGHCRLCWAQASLERPPGRGSALAPYVRRVRHHQLFLANMGQCKDIRKMGRADDEKRYDPYAPVVPVAARPHSRYLQLRLFDDHTHPIPRVYAYGRVDLRVEPMPDNEWLAWGLHLARSMAETRGWSTQVRQCMRGTLVVLLANHAEGDLVRVSDFRDVILKHSTNFEHVVEILTTMGVLADDRVPTFERWLQGKTDPLEASAPDIADDVRAWVSALREGTPRTRPRSTATAVSYLNAIHPALVTWSSMHTHLREVTRADVTAHLDTLRGLALQTTLVGLRSLFGWAKTNKVIFANPTARMRGPRIADNLWQPLKPDEIDQTIKTAVTPQTRLIIALAAIHAARIKQICALQLTDLDLPHRRLHLNGQDRPLDDLTHELALAWLDHRRQRWPGTANPHLLISVRTAIGLGPISQANAGYHLRGQAATIERLRIDRQLEEALTSGADPLHLTGVFAIAPTTAVRYANSAARLLQTPCETAPHVPSPRTPGPTPDTEADKPTSSR